MKGDPLCGKASLISWWSCVDGYISRLVSSERNESEDILFPDRRTLTAEFRWNLLSPPRYLDTSKGCSFTKVGCSVSCSGRLFNVFQGDSINQGDLVVEIVH